MIKRVITLFCAAVILTGNIAARPLSDSLINVVRKELTAKHGATSAERISKGVSQLAAIWSTDEGAGEAFRRFCLDNFMTEAELAESLPEIAGNLALLGSSGSVVRSKFNEPFDFVDVPEFKADRFFRDATPSYDAYGSGLAHFLKLNFPVYSVAEKNRMAGQWTRDQWLMNAIGDYFPDRRPVSPDSLLQTEMTKYRRYMENYFFRMDHIKDQAGKYIFPAGTLLHSHRGIRDNTKEEYNRKDGFKRQKLSGDILEAVFNGEVPEQFLTDTNTRWDPYKKELFVMKNGREERIDGFATESDYRYKGLKTKFLLQQEIDKVFDNGSTFITRNFGNANLDAGETKKLIEEILANPLNEQIGTIIKKRLKRDLQPFDVWYSGFQEQAVYEGRFLDSVTKSRYPDPKALQDDLPEILERMGFPAGEAEYVGTRINVHAVVSGGYSSQPDVAGGKALVTTMFDKSGLDYKGYRVVMHELGHAVCGVYCTAEPGNFLLAGVPTGGITEGMAEIFAYKNIEGLDLFPFTAEEKKHLLAMATMWYMYEMGGNSLTDIMTWEWMYEHPDASVAELKNAVLDISAGIWNKYFSKTFGNKKESHILSVYNHFTSGDLYLYNYYNGAIYSYLLAGSFSRNDLAGGLKNACSEGITMPGLWLEKAIGKDFSPEPLFEDVRKAIQFFNN
jgi:hypothetical protein